MLHSCIKGFLRAKKLWVNPPKAERAKPSLSSDYNLLFKNKIGESSLDIHRFVILDFLTGTLAAVLNGTWTSKRNALGVLKKMLALCIVALAHGLDVAFCELLPFQIIESITICAYMAGEFGSIIENLDKMGLRVVPPVVRKLIDALNAKLDRTVDKVAESDIKETGK